MSHRRVARPPGSHLRVCLTVFLQRGLTPARLAPRLGPTLLTTHLEKATGALPCARPLPRPTALDRASHCTVCHDEVPSRPQAATLISG